MDRRLIETLATKCECLCDSAMIDTYNKRIYIDIACTILTNINTANHHFIMEKIEIVGRKHKGQSGIIYGVNGIAPTITTNKGDGLPIVLGWTRDKHGNLVNRHPVQVANTITSAKRDNNQNYVVDNPFRIRKLTERGVFD